MKGQKACLVVVVMIGVGLNFPIETASFLQRYKDPLLFVGGVGFIGWGLYPLWLAFRQWCMSRDSLYRAQGQLCEQAEQLLISNSRAASLKALLFLIFALFVVASGLGMIYISNKAF